MGSEGDAALIRFVTFDCAGTLVKLHCSVEQAVVAAAGVGTLEGQLFQPMYLARLPEFHAINLRRDPAEGSQFWERLLSDWLTRIGRDPGGAEALQEKIEAAIFTTPSCMFSLFEDVQPCLETLKRRGVRMAVLSNWDYSLHRVLRFFAIDSYFELAVASLEEGMEKPDPRLFSLTLERLGATPDETLHVGDDPIDDVEGATSVGMTAVLLDRHSVVDRGGSTIQSLSDLERSIWND
jgi:putative hydrolase of the HAD superfamily